MEARNRGAIYEQGPRRTQGTREAKTVATRRTPNIANEKKFCTNQRVGFENRLALANFGRFGTPQIQTSHQGPDEIFPEVSRLCTLPVNNSLPLCTITVETHNIVQECLIYFIQIPQFFTSLTDFGQNCGFINSVLKRNSFSAYDAPYYKFQPNAVFHHTCHQINFKPAAQDS